MKNDNEQSIERLSAALEAERREKELLLRRASAQRILRETGLPEFLCEVELGASEAEIRARAEQLASWHSESVKNAVQSRFAPYTPAAGRTGVATDPQELSDDEYYRSLEH